MQLITIKANEKSECACCLLFQKLFGCLHALRPVANYLLNDALRLDNELSALAATCSLRSVSKVQKKTTWAYRILYKIAKFHGVYLKFRRANSAENFT